MTFVNSISGEQEPVVLMTFVNSVSWEPEPVVELVFVNSISGEQQPPFVKMTFVNSVSGEQESGSAAERAGRSDARRRSPAGRRRGRARHQPQVSSLYVNSSIT